MPRGRMSPNVNASLIHEARMIIQHFLTGRQVSGLLSTRVGNTHAKPPVCKHPVLKCCFCVDGTDAHAVINGYSVCERHEPRARSIIAVTPVQG